MINFPFTAVDHIQLAIPPEGGGAYPSVARLSKNSL